MLNAKARLLRDNIVGGISYTLRGWWEEDFDTSQKKHLRKTLESVRNDQDALRLQVAQRLDLVVFHRKELKSWAACLAATEEGLARVHQGADVCKVLVDISVQHRCAAECRQRIRKQHPGQEDTLYGLERLRKECLQSIDIYALSVRRIEQYLNMGAGIFHDHGWELPEALTAELQLQLGASC